MKRKHNTLFTFIIFFIMIPFFIGGCANVGKIKETAEKNMETEKKLPAYELNKENFKEISYDNKTYIIKEDTVELKDLKDPIGKVSEDITIDDKNKILDKKELSKIYIIPNDKDETRIHLSFGWIYSINDNNSDEIVAISVNNKYHTAEKIK